MISVKNIRGTEMRANVLHLDERFQSVQRVPAIILCETASLPHCNMEKKKG